MFSGLVIGLCQPRQLLPVLGGSGSLLLLRRSAARAQLAVVIRTGYKQWARAQNTHLRMGPLKELRVRARPTRIARACLTVGARAEHAPADRPAELPVHAHGRGGRVLPGRVRQRRGRHAAGRHLLPQRAGAVRPARAARGHGPGGLPGHRRRARALPQPQRRRRRGARAHRAVSPPWAALPVSPPRCKAGAVSVNAHWALTPSPQPRARTTAEQTEGC